MSYEGGLSIALLLWLATTVHCVIVLNSTLHRNLRKLGRRLSWLTLRPEPMDAADLQRSALWTFGKAILVFGCGFLLAFTSWLYVAMVVGQFLYQRGKDSGAPQAVREFRWALRNRELSFDELVRELMKSQGLDLAEFSTVRAELLDDLRQRGIG